MSENKFAPLMAEFLRQLAQEVENNKALARRLAQPFQTVLLESLAAQSERRKKSQPRSASKGKKYPVPEGLNPFKIFYDEGSPGLIHRLHNLPVDELKGLLSEFTEIPRKDYTPKQNREILINMLVQEIKNVATRSEAFGNYQLE
jgi:hypothetical protein